MSKTKRPYSQIPTLGFGVIMPTIFWRCNVEFSTIFSWLNPDRGARKSSIIWKYEKKLTEAETETVSLNWGTPDILICTDPFMSWWLQMPWCQTGARLSTSTMLSWLWLYSSVTRTMSHYVTPNEKKTLGRQPVGFCRVRTLMVIILYVATILQTTFSKAFSGTKIVVFWFGFHLNLCPIKNYPAWCHFLN